jgi:uncharacterized protein DUF4209
MPATIVRDRKLEVDKSELENIISFIEKIFLEAIENVNSAIPTVLKSSEWLVHYKRSDKSIIEKKVGWFFEKKAMITKGLLSGYYLNESLKYYSNSGSTLDLSRVEKELRNRSVDIKDDMKKINIKVEISCKEFNDYISNLMRDNLNETFGNIGLHFLLKKKTIVDQIEGLKIVAPFHLNFPVSLYRNDGTVSEVIKPLNEDEEGYFLFKTRENFLVNGFFLNETLKVLREKFDLNSDKIIKYLSKLDHLDEIDFSILRKALEDWFSGDFYSASNLMIPQIENCLRGILRKFGGSSVKFDPNGGGTRKLTMGEIINDPLFKARFNSDGLFHLKALYVSPKGFNLRNDMSHGLCKKESIDEGITNWVLHTLLYLAEVA